MPRASLLKCGGTIENKVIVFGTPWSIATVIVNHGGSFVSSSAKRAEHHPWYGNFYEG
jgi:hypothetical protein